MVNLSFYEPLSTFVFCSSIHCIMQPSAAARCLFELLVTGTGFVRIGGKCFVVISSCCSTEPEPHLFRSARRLCTTSFSSTDSICCAISSPTPLSASPSAPSAFFHFRLSTSNRAASGSTRSTSFCPNKRRTPSERISSAAVYTRRKKCMRYGQNWPIKFEPLLFFTNF